MNRKKPITAEELLAELHADPEWVAAREREDEALRMRKAEWRKAEASLIEELREAGLQVDSAWDLVNTSKPYPEALPILLRHLQHPYPDAVREGIARALAVRDARFGWDMLAQFYRDEENSNERAKDGLAVAVAVAADESVIDRLISLAKDRRNGSSRILLLRRISRFDDPRARAALMELGTDPDLAKQVQVILREQKGRSKRA
jgi:hypothetical protein